MLFIDLETTGLSDDSQIVEVAIVDSSGRCLHSTRYDYYRGLQEESVVVAALEYNKLSREELTTYPKCTAETLQFIYNILKRTDYVVAHNVSFDSRILSESSLRLIGTDIFSDITWKCSMIKYAESKNIKSKRIKLPNLQLSSIAHSALSDVQNCRLLWLSLETEVETNDWNW